MTRSFTPFPGILPLFPSNCGAFAWNFNCTSASIVIDGITNNLERYMDLLAARQKLVTSNIANADTPGYKTQDLNFQADFQSLIGSDSNPASPHSVQVSGLPTRNDGNNVDLDREARLLAENALRFSVASNLMRSQLSMVKNAIKEGQSS